MVLRGQKCLYWKFSMSLLLSNEEEKSLSVKFPNSRIVLQYDKKSKDHLILDIIYSLQG